MNVAERIAYFGRYRPEALAIRTDGQDLTWAALEQRVARLAGGLETQGVGIGDRVAILAMNSVDFCALALATMRRGAIVVPLNIRLAPPELRQILDHARPAVVAYDATLQPLHDGAAGDDAPWTRVSLDGTATAPLRLADLEASSPSPIVRRDVHDTAVLGYTSGTTGLPKGVMLTHGNLAALALQTALSEGSSHERRTLLCIPLAFTGGIVNNFLSTALSGGTLILQPTFDPEVVVRTLEQERITTLFAVTIMWQAIAASPGFADADLSALRSAITGGAPVPRGLLDTYHAKGVAIRQAYGLTEATGSVSMPNHEQALRRPECAGAPNIHTEVRIVGEDGHDLPDGEIGEILVRGPQVMGGYWEDPAATAETIDAEGFLHTGDMALVDDEGMLRIADRKKSMFISGGLNVYPAEIERIVDSLPDVAESVAFGLAHERFGEACAIVVRGVDGPVDEGALVAHVRTQLADYKVPRTVIQVTTPLPRGMSGKILRDRVPAMLEGDPA